MYISALARGSYWRNNGRVIFLLLFVCLCIWTEPQARSINFQKKQDQCSPIRTEQASSIKYIFYEGSFKSADKLIRLHDPLLSINVARKVSIDLFTFLLCRLDEHFYYVFQTIYPKLSSKHQGKKISSIYLVQ